MDALARRVKKVLLAQLDFKEMAAVTELPGMLSIGYPV